MGKTIRLPTMANRKRSRFLSLLLLGAVAAFVSPPVAQASLILTDANGQPANTVAQSFVDLSAELRRLRDGDLVAAGSSDAQSVQLDFPLKSRDFH